MTVSPFDHPILSGLLGDEDVSRAFSIDAEVDAMLRFEVALAEAEAEEGVIPAVAAKTIAKALGRFRPDVARLRIGMGRDGVAVPDLVAQMHAAIGEPHGRHVHFGATSQDVVDTALALRIAPLLDGFGALLDGLTAALKALQARDGKLIVMAHTRMQAAIPVPASRKIASWREPLLRHRARLVAVRKAITVLHFGGAAGTLDKLKPSEARAVSKRVADMLALTPLRSARHSERDGIAELSSWLSLVTGSLGKLGQDVALAAQSEVGDIVLSSGGGSSAMPHKRNPVAAEALVALARFNATLLSGVHQALVHENERSGGAWTLEWMLLPQMLAATGAALRLAGGLVPQISFREIGKNQSPATR
ncbi:MAG: 3-carboxy-cis,cis-muconate cycloisomerase [Rhizobiaceae bacterium]